MKPESVLLALCALLIAGIVAVGLLMSKRQDSELAACRPPTEYEQLHIVVVLRGEKLVSECMYVGTRGTYKPGGRK